MRNASDESFVGRVFRDVDLTGARFVDCHLVDVSMSGWMERLVVNDVDVTAYVWGELDRRFPERVQLRQIRTADDFRRMWGTIELLWEETTARAAQLPEAQRSQRVHDEWSFVETLRHLVFVTDAWLGRTVRDEERPYHRWGLSHTGVPREGASAMGLELDAEPSYDQVLAVRGERMALVGRTLEDLADADLDRLTARPPVPGHPEEKPSVRLCLSVLMDEEVEHRRYAERDLAVLAAAVGGAG